MTLQCKVNEKQICQRTHFNEYLQEWNNGQHLITKTMHSLDL